jgi:hypothetical protein
MVQRLCGSSSCDPWKSRNTRAATSHLPRVVALVMGLSAADAVAQLHIAARLHCDCRHHCGHPFSHPAGCEAASYEPHYVFQIFVARCAGKFGHPAANCSAILQTPLPFGFLETTLMSYFPPAVSVGQAWQNAVDGSTGRHTPQATDQGSCSGQHRGNARVLRSRLSAPKGNRQGLIRSRSLCCPAAARGTLSAQGAKLCIHLLTVLGRRSAVSSGPWQAKQPRVSG